MWLSVWVLEKNLGVISLVSDMLGALLTPECRSTHRSRKYRNGRLG